jgi:hypothetical protein
MVAMSNLNKLFHKIDSFYHTALADYKLSKIAADPPSTWHMEDDEEEPETDRTPGTNELYNKVQDAARKVRDPEIVSEALLIASMYSKALLLNDGFNTVKKAVSNALNLIDVDDPDDEDDPVNQLIDALGEIGLDAGKRAKASGGGFNKGDSDVAVKALREAKDQYNREDRERELAGQNKSVSDLSDYDDKAKGVFDMSGGVGMEEAGKGFGRGYSSDGRTYKDWIKAYETEKQRYIDELTDEKNPKIAEKKRNLIATLDKLKQLVATKNMLEEKLGDAEDAGERARLGEVEDKIRAARKSMINDKAGIRNDMLARQSDQLLAQYQAEKNPKEKLILQHKLLLLKTMRSEDKNKGAETKARKQLLAWLPGMSATEIGKATYDKLLKNIEEASGKKIPIKDWNKTKAKETGVKMRKLEVSEELQKAREEAGLGRYKVQNVPGARDWMGMRLEGFIDNLSKAMLAERKTAKDRLVGSKNKKIKDEHKTLFKPLLDSIADATKKQDRTSMLTAVQKLRAGIKDQMHLMPEFSQFVLSVRISRPVHVFKDQLEDLRKLKIEEKPALNEFDVAAVNSVIANGEEAANRLENIDIKQIGPRGTNTQGPSGPSYKNPYATQINYIRNAVAYLHNILDNKTSQQQPVSAGEKDVGPEKMDEETGEVLYRRVNPDGTITYESVED